LLNLNADEAQLQFAEQKPGGNLLNIGIPRFGFRTVRLINARGDLTGSLIKTAPLLKVKTVASQGIQRAASVRLLRSPQ